jgi:hypothetical protein
MSDVIYTQPIETPIATQTSANGRETDWSGWERWLDGWLAIERQAIAETFAEELNELEAKRDQQVRELELRLAECTGALAAICPGKSLRVKGTYSTTAEYRALDIVAVNGSSFIAREDNPGPCPGPHWQLLASAGRRGERGPAGPKGARGEPGTAAGPGFKGFHVDRKTYVVSIITTDGRIHALPLRGLFEQFLIDVQGR